MEQSGWTQWGWGRCEGSGGWEEWRVGGARWVRCVAESDTWLEWCGWIHG